MSNAIATIAQVAIAIVYVENAGILYSVKSKDLETLKTSPNKDTLDKYFAGCVLKHNPTCVFSTTNGRRSFDEARPMYNIGKNDKGKNVLVKLPTAEQPATVIKTTSAGKTVKVAQVGPTTIYVRQGDKDTRPFSIKPEQLELLKTDATALRFMGKLKHNPTCVEFNLVNGLVSTDTNRPMYNMDAEGVLALVAKG